MSDVEEPPTKMSKYEEYLDPDCEESLEDGQEEWLSEGVLTDDDYIQTIEQEHEPDKSDANLPTSQDDQDTNQTLEDTDTIQTTTVIGKVEMSNGSNAHASITHGNNTQNIEEQLNNLESTKNGDELPDDLEAFLIRKTDGQVVETKLKEDLGTVKVKPQPEEDDGNDTDDLLRMLGEGDQKVKKKSFKMIKSEKADDQGSSDDDFIYERSKVKTLKLAKNALIKRTATKAIPEDMSDGDDETDQSSDEGRTVQRMFEVKKVSPVVVKSEPPKREPPKRELPKRELPKRIVKHVVQVNTNFNRIQKPEQKFNNKQPIISQKQPVTSQKPTLKPAQSTPKQAQSTPKSAQSTPKQAQSTSKPAQSTPKLAQSTPKSAQSTPKPAQSTPKPAPQTQAVVQKPKPVEVPQSKYSLRRGTTENSPLYKPVEVKTPAPFKPLDKSTSKDKVLKSEVKKEELTVKKEESAVKKEESTVKKEESIVKKEESTVKKEESPVKKEEFDEEINEEEFLEDGDIDLDEEEFGEESEGEDTQKQRIMKPEMMDEEVPSDTESRSEDGSLYDELPSSDSEDLDDWFTLDIRAERAGDYLPLLGEKARDLLLAERRRVSTRVATLRQSLSALTESARRQADQLRSAAMALAEIDDTLRAA